MKKNLFLKFFVLAVIGAFVTFTSCKDYDDDINNLQNQITDLKTKVDKINTDLAAGASIKSVTPNANGITIELSNGTKHEIKNGTNGTNGTNGKDGKDGSVVTIGENGNWFIDGKDTGKASKGANGKDGVYYMPDADGFWHKYENGKGTATTNKWLPEGTITAVWDKANNSLVLHNVEGSDEPIAIGLVGLNNLVLIPDYVADNGGALPIMNFSPLVTSCGQIAPATLVRYQLSPTNVSEKMIDKDKLYFKLNNPTVRASVNDLNAKAEFVSLQNGVLTVRAKINTDSLNNLNGTTKITQMMLVVPTSTGQEVISDWAKVVASPINGLALVRKPAAPTGEEVWTNYEFVKTLTAAQALATADVRTVELAYDETLDLKEVVKTMIKNTPWSDFNIDTYNLDYTFDLKDTDGTTIVYELGQNKTDQQKFLNLVGSKVSTRVYDLDGPNPAAQDRTPIVHVTVKTKDGSLKCNVLEGFIKINIVEARVEPVPPVTIPVEGNVVAGCENYTLRVGTKQMNEEFYAKAKVSKEFFHANYTWAQLTGGVGTITQVVDTADTQSYNLVWTVTPSELANNIGKEITKSGTYTYGPNVIKVTFKANVTQPEINVGVLTLDNYWFDNKSYMKFNTAVPDSGSTNSALNTFDTNINNGFKTVSKTDARLNLGTGYTYEYFFDVAANQPVKSYNGITVSVSTNKKQLIATRGTVSETIATINAQSAANGDVLSYSSTSALGKELLNAGAEHMKARLYVEVKNSCGQVVKVKGLTGSGNAFNVHFLRPVNVEGKSAKNFIDGVDFGKEGSILDLKDVVRLADWRNYAKNTDKYYFDPNNGNYYSFYNVTALSVDVDNIVPVGLKSNGQDVTSLPTTIEITTTPASSTSDFGTLTYKNNGAILDGDFTLKVPVTVTYKWGEVETIVNVLVKKTSAARSAKK